MKMGKLIKQNKMYDKYDSNSTNDSNYENVFSELLLSEKVDSSFLSKSKILISDKKFSRLDFEEAQNLIKSCPPEGQLILIVILEIQLTLKENENNYIKIEEISEKFIEKNIYMVIAGEIHKRIHKEKNNEQFGENCLCIYEQIEKNNSVKKKNFKYENIDSIICKLKNNNKNIEFISIKMIFISFYNLVYEYLQKYMEINEYNKKNNYCEYSIFEHVINDFVYIIDKIKFVNIDFNQSLNNFKNIHNLSFSFEDLFRDIFFNAIFHNQTLGCQFIQAFTNPDYNIKNSLLKILNIISTNQLPLNKSISNILNIENLFNFNIDLSSKIIEKSKQLNINIGLNLNNKEIKSKVEDEKQSETSFKKEVIYGCGSFEKNDNDKFNIMPAFSKINMEKIFLDIEKNDIKSIPIQIFHNHIFKNENNKNCVNINDCDNQFNNNYDTVENYINNNYNKNEINDKNDKKESFDKMNMENKSLDEIYEYISKDNKVKNKKKNKKRNTKNKAKSKKNNEINKENEYSGKNMDQIEDPIVIQFKKDINEDVINANSIRKIKPLISEKWIKSISSD